MLHLSVQTTANQKRPPPHRTLRETHLQNVPENIRIKKNHVLLSFFQCFNTVRKSNERRSQRVRRKITHSNTQRIKTNLRMLLQSLREKTTIIQCPHCNSPLPPAKAISQRTQLARIHSLIQHARRSVFSRTSTHQSNRTLSLAASPPGQLFQNLQVLRLPCPQTPRQTQTQNIILQKFNLHRPRPFPTN